MFDDVLEVVDGFIQPAPVEPVTVQIAFEIREVADSVVVALRLPAAPFETRGAAKVFDGPVDDPAPVAITSRIDFSALHTSQNTMASTLTGTVSRVSADSARTSAVRTR